MKTILKENLVIRDSFSLPFAGGEIWAMEFDSLSIHTDIVKNKFLKEMEITKRPSTSAFISINLTDTLVNLEIAELIVSELNGVKRPIIKVAIIGLSGTDKKLFKSILKRQIAKFSYEFFIDTEKAKEWLIISKK